MFARQLIKVQFLGDSFNQQEQWTTGFYMAPNFGSASLPGDLASKIAPHWQTFFTAAGSSISNKYRTISIKANLVGTDGKQITNPTQEYFYPAPIVGANAAAPLPPQITLVASLRNNLPRGLATHGRMYLPGINAGVDADARIAAGTRTTIATAFQSFLNSVNLLATSSGNFVHIASFKGTGTDRPVTKLLMGDLYDTQRRRKNALTEQYSTVTVTTP